VVYTVTLSDGSAIDSSLITFTMASRTFSFYSIDNSKDGTYNLKVTGYFTGMPINSYQSATFTLTVGPDCSTASITSSSLTSQSYTVNSGASTYVFPEFTSACTTCFTICPVNYVLTLSDDSAYDASVITFTASTKTIQFQSTDNIKAGTYSLKVTGYFTGMVVISYQSALFSLTVLPDCSIETLSASTLIA
jgi:hypothetical protein